jgi:hypothetical protein
MSSETYYHTPRVFDMETVCRYMPLTPGMNTIRLLSEKYENIQPGDIIRMQYNLAGDEYGIETVVVKSVHVSSLTAICLAHARHNHVYFNQAPNVLRDQMLNLYGEELCETSFFIAIYV